MSYVREVPVARIATGLLSLGIALAPSARAQTPRAPADTVAPAPPRSGSIGHRHSPMMLLVVPAGMVVAVAAYFAPAPLGLLLGERDTTHRALMPDQQMAWMALGGRFEGGQTWTHALGVESFRGNLHGELTAEDLWRPRHIQYVSVRGSYLWHSRQHVAGGVSLGYMHADVEPTQRGIELGLPLLLADAARRDVRLEPTYVLGPSGVLFNYRLQLHVPVAHSRFVMGASVLAKGNPPPPRGEAYPGDFTGTGYMLLLGTRF